MVGTTGTINPLDVIAGAGAAAALGCAVLGACWTAGAFAGCAGADVASDCALACARAFALRRLLLETEGADAGCAGADCADGAVAGWKAGADADRGFLVGACGCAGATCAFALRW